MTTPDSFLESGALLKTLGIIGKTGLYFSYTKKTKRRHKLHRDGTNKDLQENRKLIK